MQTLPLPLADDSILTVSALNRQARLLLEGRLGPVWVRGEISNYRRPGSGHWYFTLKDDGAQVRCAMFANRNRAAKLQPTDGTEVLVRGRVSLYEERGDYQIIVEHLEPAGEGALRAAFEALKNRLAAEGLFDVERKKPLPTYPAHLAVLSSRSGAALRDVLSIIGRRFPCLAVTLVPVAVQGAEAERQLLNALRLVPELRPDLVLITRGGGSLEDLVAFNSEPLARAIAACPVPTVAAIGHETDFTIAELVADLRGATPSAAAELLTPDGAALARQFGELQGRLGRSCATRINLVTHGLAALSARLSDPRQRTQQLMQRADDLDERLHRALHSRTRQLATRIDTLRRSLRLLRPAQRIEGHRESVERLASGARRLMVERIQNGRGKLATLARTLAAVSPLATLARGFAIVTRPDGQAITNAAAVEVGEAFQAHFPDGTLDAVAQNKKPVPERFRPIDD